ncbi:MAG: hypothetical protein GY896_22735 [Gammaproteobacteria bacterium]|nr:hypothetical protein [Gammaproteobacteria bacterium]
MKHYTPHGHFFHGENASILVVDSETGKTRKLGFAGGKARHSPDGFSWGYAGSGPAELARAIIADVSNDPDPHPALYQAFKNEFLGASTLDQNSTSWSISEDVILQWLKDRREKYFKGGK